MFIKSSFNAMFTVICGVTLLRGREYDPHSALDRQLLAYVFIPVVQRECDISVRYWSSHGIRV